MKREFRQIKNLAKAIIFGFLLTLGQNTIFGQEFHGGTVPPTYTGGNKALKEFIDKNLNFPESVKKLGISGTVTVSMIIDKDGEVENVRLLRGIHAVCDSEAIRVTRLLKDWQPAINFGKPIRCSVLLPIEFSPENNLNDKQPFTVSGTIIEKYTWKPVEGALIIIKGTNVGTVSDARGRYKLEIPGENYELEISSMGYATKTEQIGNNATINIELEMKYENISFD